MKRAINDWKKKIFRKYGPQFRIKIKRFSLFFAIQNLSIKSTLFRSNEKKNIHFTASYSEYSKEGKKWKFK